MKNEIDKIPSIEIPAVSNTTLKFDELFKQIREDLRDNPYIIETIKVLPAGGYRSAIGSIWNAVVDDLRNKVIYRSLDAFNKEVKLQREIKKYDDFQDFVNDDALLDGAYRIGVIGWEAHKVLKQTKDTRHIFDGHPRSSNPDLIKTFSMISDCVKYVLSQEYPPQIIDIDSYISNMGSGDFDRNEISITNAISDLPDEYKNELINRLFSSYVNENCSTILRSNIEIVAPILWRVLPKTTAIQVAKRVDKEINKGNSVSTNYAFAFIGLVGTKKYLSSFARKYHLAPYIKKLKENLDNFSVENECVDELSKYAGYVPRELLSDYVRGLTQTYVGKIGISCYCKRTDFYADLAAIKIPKMFESFDDESAHEFVNTIKTNGVLQQRIKSNVKLRRLRNLGEIVFKRISENFDEKDFLEALLDQKREKEFFEMLRPVDK